MTHILIADSDPRTRQALALLLERRLGIHSIGEAWDRACVGAPIGDERPGLDPVGLLPARPVGSGDCSPDRTLRRAARLALMSVNTDDVTTAQMLA